MSPSRIPRQRSPHEDPISIVVASDTTYAYPTSVMIASLAATAQEGRTIDLYVIADGFSSDAADRFHRSLEHTAGRARERGVELTFSFLRPDTASLAGLNGRGHISEAAYLRLLIPDMLPDVSRAIYLDGDILICRDIGELWESDLKGTPAGAVLSMNKPTIAQGMDRYTERNAEPLPADSPYMNSGVLVLDLDRWRAEGIGELAIRDLQAHQHLYPCLDQDAINAVLVDNWTVLPLDWNVQTVCRTSEYHRSPITNIAALHFPSARKPWTNRFVQRMNTNVPDRFETYQALFFERAKQSGWFTDAEWRLYRLSFRMREVSAHARWAADRIRTKGSVGRALRRTSRSLTGLLSRKRPLA